MMRAICLLALACVGCAPAATAGPEPTGPVDVVDIPSVSGSMVRVSVDRNPTRTAIAAPVRDAWAALAEVYDAFKITLEFADVGAYRTGNTRFVAPRTISGLPRSRYFRCGLGPAGDLADLHRVTMHIITELHPAGTDSTLVFTQLTASGRPMDGTSTEAVVCASTGLLESAIAQLLRRRVQEKARRF